MRALVNVNSCEVFIGVNVIGSSCDIDTSSQLFDDGETLISIHSLQLHNHRISVKLLYMILINISSGGPACIYHVIQLKYHFVFLDDTCALTRKGEEADNKSN